MKMPRPKSWIGLSLSLFLIIVSGLALANSRKTVLAAPLSPPQLTLPEPQQGPPPPGSSSAAGYLSGQAAGDPLDIALAYIHEHRKELGLTEEDLADIVVKDRYTSQHNGVTHIYLRQRLEGIEVFNGDININITAEGRVLNMGNNFVPDLQHKVDTTTPSLTPIEAAGRAVQHLGLTLTEPLTPRRNIGGASQEVVLSEGGVSLEEIPVKLFFEPEESGKVRLAWNVGLRLRNGLNWWQLRVDATNGDILEQNDWIVNETYRVFAFPKESPSDGGQTDVVNPQSAAANASPFGWHDTNGAPGAESTSTQGNNVSAQDDIDANNSGGSRPSNAGLNFGFSANLSQEPPSYLNAAITNLFYWNNIIHDITYQYGFTELAGNFQENNYSKGGAGGDPVQADAQDGSGINNANFGTPPDGSDPRMQMFRWNLTVPERDSDLDNGVIIHEYGHGISNRLTGGPGNTSCLFNAEQMGEGWSDWFALALTASAGDTGATKRGIGTYVIGEPTTGNGIRDFPYSTDLAIDPRTYNTIKNTAIPHGVGSTWAAMLWEVYWALVTEYGFDSDLYNGNGGNNLAIQLVMDGLKLQKCNPGFIDGRNAILAADAAPPHNGANQCLIWRAFAKRGLGFSATQGSSDRVDDGTEAFDLPPTCSLLSAAPATQNICVGSNAVYTVTVGSAFVGSVNLNVGGRPAGTTANFTPNPVNGPFPKTSKLTIGNTAGATPGAYDLNITGSDGTRAGATTVKLNVNAGPPAGGTTLASPPNGATSQSTQPTFTWSSNASSAQNFRLQVATDPGFTNIVYTAVVVGNSHTPANPLASNTKYYWRVIPQNNCGAGASSPVFNFTTAILMCSSPSKPIPDDGNLVDTLAVPNTGQILDLDVFIDAPHTWVGDLSFTLKHVPSGTSVTLIDRPGFPASNFGCSNDSIKATLSDESGAPVESQCALETPTINGTFKPNQALSAFDNKNLNGTWELTVADAFQGDTGTLLEWCLIPQTASQPPVSPVIVVNTTSLSSTQSSGTTANKSFTIRNGGQQTLAWTVDDKAAGFSGVPAVAVTPGQGGPERLGPTSPQPPGQRPLPEDLLNVVKDGSFEEGTPNSKWTEASTNFGTPLCDVPGCGTGGGSGPRSGSFWAWFGGEDFFDEEGSLAQSVTIPTGTATLNFYLEQPACDSASDYLEIRIDGTRVFLTKGDNTDLCNKVGYKLQTVNVSAFANGGAHTLTFHSETFSVNGGPTNFFVDDVSLTNKRCVPNNIPWLTVSPATGSNTSGVTKPVQVTFNSTGLLKGTYQGTLCIDSNDPVKNPVLLPVKLTVTTDPQRKLYLPAIRKQN